MNNNAFVSIAAVIACCIPALPGITEETAPASAGPITILGESFNRPVAQSLADVDGAGIGFEASIYKLVAPDNRRLSKLVGQSHKGRLTFRTEILESVRSRVTLGSDATRLVMSYDAANQQAPATFQGLEGGVPADVVQMIQSLSDVLEPGAGQSQSRQLSVENLVGSQPHDLLFQFASMIAHFASSATDEAGSGDLNVLSGTVTLPGLAFSACENKVYDPGICCPDTRVRWDEDEWGSCTGGWCQSDNYVTTGEGESCHGRCGGGCDQAPHCWGNMYTAACALHDGTGNALAFAEAMLDCVSLHLGCF